MSRRVRVAIAGTGFIGAVHARSARLAGARLVGVAASTPESGRRAAAALGADHAFASAQELVEAAEVDVVHICTPNHLHVALAEAALATGKHVICEKPIALDGSGAQRLADAAAGAQRIAAVPFVYRYYPTVREARERVRTGVTGPLRLLHGSYLQDWLLRPEDDNWRVDEQLGGASRAFADIGSHWCDLAEFVSGHRITRLSARTLTALGERFTSEPHAAFQSANSRGAPKAVATEDAALIQFETDQGAVGSAVISQISGGRKNRLVLELDGGEEALAFNQEEPESLWVGRREATTLIQRDPEHLTAAAARYATLPPGHPQGYGDCFDAFVAEAYEAVQGDTAPEGLPVFADGLRAARITDAVLTSAREERWVELTTPIAGPVVKPGSSDSRGASRPLSRPEASPPGFALAAPLADRTDPKGPALRVPVRSTIDGAHDHESSTIDRARRAKAIGVRAQALEDGGDRVEVLARERPSAELQAVQDRRRLRRDLAPAWRDRGQRRAPVALVPLARDVPGALEPVDDVCHRRPVHLQAVAHLAQRERAAAAVVQEHQRLIAREREVEGLQLVVQAREQDLLHAHDRGDGAHRRDRLVAPVGAPVPPRLGDRVEVGHAKGRKPR